MVGWHLKARFLLQGSVYPHQTPKKGPPTRDNKNLWLTANTSPKTETCTQIRGNQQTCLKNATRIWNIPDCHTPQFLQFQRSVYPQHLLKTRNYTYQYLRHASKKGHTHTRQRQPTNLVLLRIRRIGWWDMLVPRRSCSTTIQLQKIWTKGSCAPNMDFVSFT